MSGITAQADRCRRYAESSAALATVLNPRIGRTIVEVAQERSGLPTEELQKLFDVFAMTEPRSS